MQRADAKMLLSCQDIETPWMLSLLWSVKDD